MKETFATARARLHAALGACGWKLSAPTLKVLWAERDGERLWFKAQAVYLNDHSLWTDIRGMSPEALLALVDRTLTIRRSHERFAP